MPDPLCWHKQQKWCVIDAWSEQWTHIQIETSCIPTDGALQVFSTSGVSHEKHWSSLWRAAAGDDRPAAQGVKVAQPLVMTIIPAGRRLLCILCRKVFILTATATVSLTNTLHITNNGTRLLCCAESVEHILSQVYPMEKCELDRGLP